jgi:predicted ATPase
MKVKFENIGFVKSATLDLDKEITLLCGPNNTGKTYIATALYGLFRFRFKLDAFSLIKTKVQESINADMVSLDIKDAITNSALEKMLAEFADQYINDLPNVFATDENFFSKASISFLDLDLDGYLKNLKKSVIEHEITLGNNFLIKLIKEEDSFNFSWLMQSNKVKEIPPKLMQSILSDVISQSLISIIIPKSFIAPVERIAINLFSKELSIKRNELIDRLLELNSTSKNSDPFDLINRRATRYPSPVRDSLQIAEDLDNFKKRTTEFDHIASQIEDDILKGKITISKEGEVQFQPVKKKIKLSSHMSASSVKALANLVIYFRHLASPHDFIIIDEPELNLHPDNQVIMARILAKLLVNKGFKVLISTHSDYIIKEFNNLIMLDSHRDSISQFEGYSEDSILKPEMVAALLFKYDKQIVQNLTVSETGFEVETIDAVINKLNITAQQLYFGI